MKSRTLFWCVMLAAVIFSVAPAIAAEVSQGKCISYDQDQKTVTIEEYDIHFTQDNPYGGPTGIVSVFNVSDALIGITPQPNDILRIAYDVRGTDRVALRVMNVSKQDLRKK